MHHGAMPQWTRACGPLLAALLLAAPALGGEGELVLPDSRRGFQVAPLLLLSRPDVRADLQLTANQVAAARHAIVELTSQARKLEEHAHAAVQKGQSDAAFAKARREIDKAQEQWLAENLSAEQRQRLEQIDLRWQGPTALITRPSLAGLLGLTSEQIQLLKQEGERRRALLLQQKWRPEDERQLAQKALAVLTPEQKSRWEELLGPPITFQTVSAKPATPRR
ncbi:MAG: hypothetical protein IRY99_23430 [Isosphaeraceae bacterium]|nr:hypothetical protein [Isosphaeraceae bacterium]